MEIKEEVKKIKYAWSFLQKKMVHVNLQLLYDCNFRCTICDFWKEPYRNCERLSLEDIKIISEKLKKTGPQIISIGGGEPLLHQDITSIVKVLSEDHFPVMICNGWFMTPEIAKSLFQSGMYEISISLDYATAEKHDRQRGKKGAFDHAVQALKILNENRIYPHQRVHMISVIMDDNLEEIEKLIQLAKKIGVTYLVTLYSNNRGKKSNRTPNLDTSKHLLYLKKKFPEFVALRGYIGKFSEAIENNGIGPCHAGSNLMNIDSRGNATFCIDHLENPAGNILKDDLVDIVNNLKLQQQNNQCRDCWTSCRGSIETLMYGKDKFYNILDYYRMAKNLKVHN